MKKTLSVFLILSIMLSVFPMTVVRADDTLQDRTNINMDYKYDKTLEQVQREARNELSKAMTNKDNGDIKWNHVSYLGGSSGDIREKLTSTSESDKYIVLDKDSKIQLGKSNYETVEITTDKVFDLNGHKIQVNDIRNKANGSDKYYQSDNSKHFNTVLFSVTSGAIIADSDMTIHLIGDNIITKQHISDTLYENVIYGYGNITLTGDGNLTLVNTGYQYFSAGSGITSAKNIYLKNTGKLTVNNAMGAFTCENGGTVYYYNGEIDFNGLISSNVYYGSLIYDKGTFSAENKVHSLTAYTGENEDTQISEGDIVTNAKKDKTSMHIIPTHNCNKEVESPEYLVISDKEHGTVYYKSCECGHTDKQSKFTVPYVEPLENTSAISTSAITLGDTVTLTGSATGGTAPYQYQMLYKKISDTKWTTKQNFSENTTVSIKPANATDYDVCIKVKDNTGTIEKKFFTVKVTNAKLTNNSTISATEITLGNTITLTGKATGGTAPYTYAMFYKKKSDTKWTTKQDFKANASVSIKPANAVEYDVCIKVKDSTGTIEKKYFSVTVK